MGLKFKNKKCVHLEQLDKALFPIKVRVADSYSEVWIECRECKTQADLEEDEDADE